MGRLEQGCLPREQESGGKDMELIEQGERGHQVLWLNSRDRDGGDTEVERRGEGTKDGLRCVD